MRKITFLEFIGKDKKSGLLKALKDQAIAEHKNIHKVLGGGLELVISRIGTATFYHRGKRLGDVSHMTLAEAFKKVDELKAERKKKLFGTEYNKDLLIAFLNALLSFKSPIEDLTYKPKDSLPDSREERGAI